MVKYKSIIGNKLNSENINFEEIVLNNPVHTVKDVAELCKCQTKQVLKTLLFMGVNNSVIIILAGEVRVNISLLESILKQNIKLATPEQVLMTTSFQIGAVSPFLITKPVNLISLADESILENKELFLGSGDPNILISMSSMEFKKAFIGEFITMT